MKEKFLKGILKSNKIMMKNKTAHKEIKEIPKDIAFLEMLYGYKKKNEMLNSLIDESRDSKNKLNNDLVTITNEIVKSVCEILPEDNTIIRIPEPFRVECDNLSRKYVEGDLFIGKNVEITILDESYKSYTETVEHFCCYAARFGDGYKTSYLRWNEDEPFNNKTLKPNNLLTLRTANFITSNIKFLSLTDKDFFNSNVANSYQSIRIGSAPEITISSPSGNVGTLSQHSNIFAYGDKNVSLQDALVKNIHCLKDLLEKGVSNYYSNKSRILNMRLEEEQHILSLKKEAIKNL